MSKTPFARSEPSLVNDTPNTPSGEPPLPLRPSTSKATLSLPTVWQPIWEWAEKAGVLYEVFLLVDATLLNERPVLLGTVLAEISSPTSQWLLEESAANGTAAKILSTLSHAYVSCPGFPTKFRPYTRGPAVSGLLSGKIPRLFLAALTLARDPTGEPPFREWITRLRTWVIVHGVQRALAGNFQDRFIRQTSRAIWQTCENSRPWRRLFQSLHTSFNDLEAIDRWIRTRGLELLNRADLRPTLTEQERDLIRVLIKVASRTPGPSDDASHPHSISAYLSPPQQYVRESAAAHFAFEVTDDDEPIYAERRQDDGDGDTDLAEIQVDVLASYSHQRLTTNSVLLLMAEELHYLPYSWQKPNPSELLDFDAWIDTALGSHTPEIRLLGAIAWLAANTGYTFRRVLDIELTQNPAAGWVLDKETWTLKRRPPMRASGWTPKTGVETEWVTPVAHYICITLPRPVAAAIGDRLEAVSDATTIGSLWNPTWAATAEVGFSRQMTGPLDRITPGKLGAIFPQRLFETSADPVLARLLGNHPQAGLPGACAYASWTETEVTQSIAKVLQSPYSVPNSAVPQIGVGSRLDPLENLIVDEIKHAGEAIKRLRTGSSAIQFHNAYTAYYVIALLAATGARPVRDPFEALTHFDFPEAFVFIDDKASGELRSGRLVPLAKRLSKYLASGYLQHLAAISAVLRETDPVLSEEIAQIANQKPTGAMPLFFFITGEKELSWTSVSEASINAQRLFTWPLPLNLFRHRLSRLLRRLGADPEVVDALAGHAEYGCATHGDDSARVWREDMASIRPLLENLYDALGFKEIHGWDKQGLVLLQPEAPSTHLIGVSSLFGARARKSKRKLRTIQAIRDANRQVNEFLGERSLTDLTEEEIHNLSKELLLNPGGLPRPTGYLRYSWLLRRITREYRRTGKKILLRKRFVRLAETSPFSEAAPGALALDAQLCAAAKVLNTQIQPSRLSLSSASALAATCLILENRITDLVTLRDIMSGKNFRITYLRRQYYLEFSTHEQPEGPAAPICRRKLSPFLASLLDRLLGAKHSIGASRTPIIPELATIAKPLIASTRLHHSATTDGLLRALCETIDQVSVMTLPGIAAGYLAGRVPSTSLGWHDWLRLETGKSFHIPNGEQKNQSEDTSSNEIEDLPVSSGSSRKPSGETEELQKSAKKFFSALRDCFAPYTTNLSTSANEAGREDIRQAIRKTVREHRDSVSSAVSLLGQWVASLIMRKRTKKEFIDIGTVQRYLTALSPMFEEAAADIDIFGLDEEEMSELYTALLEARPVKQMDMVCGRLLDFHRWARRQGVNDPDWDDVPIVMNGNSVSPGFISEAEYRTALKRIQHLPTESIRYRKALGLILLLCYRFGLRAAEAIGLTRNDWQQRGDFIVVLVRRHRHRKLKTRTHSRRQVPLVFELSSLERRIIRAWMTDVESQHGDNQSAPLFCVDGSKTEIMPDKRTKQILRTVLKIATGNERTTLHHARHTAANRIANALLQLQCSTWKKAGNTDAAESIKSTLLGTQLTTRRTLWAIRRFVGHGATDTLTRSYLHLLGCWVDDLTVSYRNTTPLRKLTHAIDLEQYKCAGGIDHELLNRLPLPTQALTPLLAMRALRLVSRGKPHEEVSDSLGISPQQTMTLVEAIERLSRTTKPSGSAKRTNGETHATLGYLREFLSRISEDGWRRLTTHLQKIETHARESTESDCPQIAISIDQLLELIGPTRHILLWEPQHFDLARRFLNYVDVENDSWVLYHSRKSGQDLLDIAKSYAFSPIPLPPPLGKKPLQLDSARTGSQRYLVEQRCALIYKQNDESPVRNAIEFVLLLMAFHVANTPSQLRST